MIAIISAICMILFLPFYAYLNRQASQDLDKKVYTMPKAYLYMGYLMILISFAVLIVPRIMDNPPEYYHPLVWTIILIMFLFGIYIIKLYYNHKITIEEEGFIIYSTFGKKKYFQYNNITSVNRSLITYFITIKDKNGNKGNFYFHLKGLLTLLKKIRSESGIYISDIENIVKIQTVYNTIYNK